MEWDGRDVHRHLGARLQDASDADGVGGVDGHVLARLGALPRRDARRQPRGERVKLAQDITEAVNGVPPGDRQRVGAVHAVALPDAPSTAL